MHPLTTIRLRAVVLTIFGFVTVHCGAESQDISIPLFENSSEVPANFRRENLVAWCIVPFDARNRTPPQRAAMLVELGLRRCAYDWREQHVPTFGQEFAEYEDQSIELTAFWGRHDHAFQIFKTRNLHPQIWHMIPGPKAAGQSAKVKEAVAAMTPIARDCQERGCKLGLYNHGGWPGEPENLASVCEGLRSVGFDNVGIVYNFHHAHDQLSPRKFAAAFKRMQPYLLCLNLNGMVDLQGYRAENNQTQKKILPIGCGTHEAAMIKTVVDSRYNGPIGIIGHDASRDVREVLTENLEGLEYVLGIRPKPIWLANRQQEDYLAKWTPKARANSKFHYEVETEPDWVDERPSRMDTGPGFCHSIQVPKLEAIEAGSPAGQQPKDSNPGALKKLFPKSIAVRAKAGGNHLLFDTEQLNFVATWTGDFIQIPSARFGILNMPSVAGKVTWSDDHNLRWQAVGRQGDPRPLKSSEMKFSGYYFPDDASVGFEYQLLDATIRETPMNLRDSTAWITVRRIERSPCSAGFRVPLRRIRQVEPSISQLPNGAWKATMEQVDGTRTHVYSDFAIQVANQVVYAEVPAGKESESKIIAFANGNAAPSWKEWECQFSAIRHKKLQPHGKRKWGDPIHLSGSVDSSASSAFVVDTIPMPLENRFHALQFASGFDFVNEDSALLCTVHGDVWLVRGLDRGLTDVSWQRFATGLYQPLGLKVVDGKAIVTCRDRITRLHDTNADGEADYYESFNDDLVVTGQSHAYAMSLETDPEGNFYFIKSGGSAPHGGTMLRLSPDGERLRVFATGYRHANGLGVSPTGLVTSADNEGNWIPATRIDIVREGGFYGHMPTHRRDVRPEIYDPPLLWVPRSIDNSAGGQVWVPTDNAGWQALAGKMIHFSFGRCTANVVLPQKVGDHHQAAIYRLDIPDFASGAMRGRFHPMTGDLYVCGLDGWQTAATQDGHFQRVRATGAPFLHPTDFAVSDHSLHITFDVPLADSAVNPKVWNVSQWNYRWTEAYGSDHYSIESPDVIGHDALAVESARLSSDRKTIRLEVPNLQSVMQMHITAKIKSHAGHEIPVHLFNTIHARSPE